MTKNKQIFETLKQIFEFDEIDSNIFDEKIDVLNSMLKYFELIENNEIVELIKQQKRLIFDYINIDGDYKTDNNLKNQLL